MDSRDRNAQAIRVHETLWDPTATTVEYDGVLYPIQRRDDSFRKFAMVSMNNGIRYVTQNLRKDSAGTRWVNSHESHRLTWVFRGNAYSAQIETSKRRGTELYLLGPKRLAYKARQEAS